MSNKTEKPNSPGGDISDPRVEIFLTEEDFEKAAADAAIKAITAAICERGRCLVAFSGGRTPRGVYHRLADLLTGQSVDLSQLYIIFVDERMVPPENSESNYGMIKREFISQVPLSPLHIFRIKGELEPEIGARDYERDLQTVLPLFNGRCDLMLLGAGEDGHTASLFPGTDVLHEMQHKVRAVFVPRLESWRVTLTLPVINSARTVFFLVTGRQKAGVVGKIFASAQPRDDIPATLVRPDSGTVTWLIDSEAASQIPPVRLSKPEPAGGLEQ